MAQPERLEAVAGSAAAKDGNVEVLIVGHGGDAWEFEIGPVAAKTFALLLNEAAAEVDIDEGLADLLGGGHPSG